MKSENKDKKRESRIAAEREIRKEISVPLLAFTFFFATSIYILLLSFYFFQWRTDIKPEK